MVKVLAKFVPYYDSYGIIQGVSCLEAGVQLYPEDMSRISYMVETALSDFLVRKTKCVELAEFLQKFHHFKLSDNLGNLT